MGMLGQKPGSRASVKYSAIIGQDEKPASEGLMTGPFGISAS